MVPINVDLLSARSRRVVMLALLLLCQMAIAQPSLGYRETFDQYARDLRLFQQGSIDGGWSNRVREYEDRLRKEPDIAFLSNQVARSDRPAHQQVALRILEGILPAERLLALIEPNLAGSQDLAFPAFTGVVVRAKTPGGTRLFSTIVGDFPLRRSALALAIWCSMQKVTPVNVSNAVVHRIKKSIGNPILDEVSVSQAVEMLKLSSKHGVLSVRQIREIAQVAKAMPRNPLSIALRRDDWFRKAAPPG